jgi:transketolase
MDSRSKTALLLGDIGVYGFRDILGKYSQRAFNIGILEQSMVGVAAGLSSKGIVPTIHTIAPFVVERAFEQIKVDLGYQNLSANIVTVGASFDYAALGCTHHCPGDVSLMSTIPGVNIFIPGHKEEFKSQFEKNWNNGKINYFRLTENENSKSIELESGTSIKVRDGNDAIVIVVGPLLDHVLSAIQDFNVEVQYVNSWLNNNEFKLRSENQSKRLILIEPYYSGLMTNTVVKNLGNRGYSIYEIGVPREFLRKYGSYEQMLKYVGLDAKSLRIQIEAILNG